MTRLWTLCTLLVPSLVHAACPEGLIGNALTGRLDGSAIALLKEPLVAMMPSDIAIPESTTTLFTCGGGIFDDTTVTPKNGVAHLALSSLDVTLEEGEVVIRARADVTGDADLDLTLCALPDASCEANVIAYGVEIEARVMPWVSSCTPYFNFSELWVYAPPDDVAVWMGGCGLYDDAWNATYDWFKEALIDYASEAIISTIEEEVPTWLTQISQDVFADGYRASDLQFDVALEDIAVIDDGLVVTFAANATPTVPRAKCLPASAKLLPEPPSTVSAPLSYAPLSVTASRPFLQRVLRSAWLAGFLCFDSRELDLGLDDSLSGVFPGATLDFTVAATQAPSLALGNEVTLNVPALVAEVELGMGDAEPSLATVTVDAKVAVEIGMDGATSMLVAEPTDVTTGPLDVELTDMALGVDAASMAGFVDNLVLPMFADELGELPITSSLFLGAPVALNLLEVGVTSHHVRADFDLFSIPLYDETPPLTLVADKPNEVVAPDVRVEMSSADDQTPSDYLRHVVTIDGVTEDEPRVGQDIRVSGLTSGEHRVRIAALDLNGNIDPTPVTVSFEVDATPPVVHIESAPIGISRVDYATVTFAAYDDVSDALTFRYTMGLVQRDNVPDEPIARGRLDEGEAIELEDLPEDSIIRVTVYARDEVGNEGSATASFAVSTEATMSGCSASSPAPMMMLLVLLMTRRKRRR